MYLTLLKYFVKWRHGTELILYFNYFNNSRTIMLYLVYGISCNSTCAIKKVFLIKILNLSDLPLDETGCIIT